MTPNRRSYYSVLLVLSISLISACQARQNAAPSAVSNAPAAVLVITTTPAPSPRSVINATDIPATLDPALGGSTLSALPSGTNDPTAIKVENVIANLRDGEVVFVAHVTARAMIAGATLSYTFDISKKGAQQSAPMPPQTAGQSTEFQATMLLDDLPQAESSLTYHWVFSDANGNSVSSLAGHFKLTEATRADQRDDLPTVPAVFKFTSEFPKDAIFNVSLTPVHPIVDAHFFITQNHGIEVNNYRADVPTVAVGKPVSVSFNWNPQLAVQIPWQQFETWWVFTDEAGHIYRTTHTLNDYADNRPLHHWQRTPTRYAVLYTYDQSAANINALAVATDYSITALQTAFDYKLLYAPHIVIYNSVDDFSEWAPPALEGSFIGMASGKWGGAVIGVYNSMRFTGYSIIKHELTHVFQFQSIQQILPKWFIEGSARYMEDYPEEDDEAVTRQIVKKYGAPSLQVSVPNFSPDHHTDDAWQYYVGMTFIKYLRTTYGNNAFAKVYLALARNIDLPTALQMVTGKPFDQIDTEWRKWIMK